MKRALVILVSALTFLGLGIALVAGLSDWIAEEFIHGDDDMNTIGKLLFLGVYPILLLVGGWLGNLLYQRNLTSHSSGRPEGHR